MLLDAIKSLRLCRGLKSSYFWRYCIFKVKKTRKSHFLAPPNKYLGFKCLQKQETGQKLLMWYRYIVGVNKVPLGSIIRELLHLEI